MATDLLAARQIDGPPGLSLATDPLRRLGEWPDLARHHVYDVALALQHAVHVEQRVAPHDAAKPRPRVRPESDVDHARLVFQGQEHRALRRHWVLASDHRPPSRTGPGPRSASEALVTAP